MMALHHADTRMPTDAEPYHVEKWKLGTFIARVVDSAFSVESPPYSVITKLDEELRKMVKELPDDLRSGALPASALAERPTDAIVLPQTARLEGTLKQQMQRHVLGQLLGNFNTGRIQLTR